MGDEQQGADFATAEQESEERFAISEPGLKLLASIEDRVMAHSKSTLSQVRDSAYEVKAKFGTMPLQRLLRYVYSEFPEFTTASEIRSRVLGRP